MDPIVSGGLTERADRL